MLRLTVSVCIHFRVVLFYYSVLSEFSVGSSAYGHSVLVRAAIDEVSGLLVYVSVGG